MNDEQIVEYLRSRGQATPPLDFGTFVMTAIDSAPPARSAFIRFLPAFVAVGAAAVLMVVAFLLGQGREVGPAPSALASPSASADEVTLAELDAAVTGAVEALAASGGVQGRHVYTIEHYIASATWFDWRPNGDQVVVEMQDIDVSAPWWTDPDGQPLSVGERIETNISVVVGGSWYISRDDGWTVALDEGRPLTYGIGMLTGDMPAVAGIPPNADATVSRDDLQDGGEVWTLEFEGEEGTVTVEWRMDAEARLVSYAVQGAGVAMTPGVNLGTASTRAVIEFTPLAGPEPIAAPDLAIRPDPAFFGFPDDFPLAPSASEPAPEPVAAVQLAECIDPTGTYRVALPEGWWTNPTFDHPLMGEQPACHFFGPAAFEPAGGDPDNVVPPGVSFTISFLDGGCIGFINPELSQRELEIDGWPATATEFAQGKEEANPPGHLQYVINLRPGVDCEAGGAFIVARTAVEMEGDYEANKAILDEVMASMEITFEGP